MKLRLLITSRRHIIPSTPEDAELLRSVPSGHILTVDVRLARNGAHHRKWRAFLAIIADNRPDFASVDHLEAWLKLKTGLCETYVSKNGKTLYELGSTSFGAMDEGEFIAWTAKARAIIKEEIWPDLRRVDAETKRQLAEWEAWE